jgi:CRP/FNR family cyclic AMP-dependent transcriptional regulator
MDIAVALGYIASGLVLGASMMRTMIPLRLVGIVGNITFIVYGYAIGLVPVMVLHATLLPLNIYRLVEMRRLIHEVENAESDGDLTWLTPFMRSESRAAGATLFRKGDDANAMYLLTDGRIRLEEINVGIKPGELIGEIGLFSSHGKRTATAVCTEECRLQSVTRSKVRELVFQNPQFSFYMIGVITSRLTEDLQILEHRGTHSDAAASGT